MRDNYIRQAMVTRVLDGDTFEAEVNLGFTAMVRVRFRIRGVNTPETFRPSSPEERERGLLATAFTQNLILGKTVAIQSYKMGAYARWEADIFLMEGQSVAELLKNAGHSK